MKISQSIFARGKKGGDAKGYANTWTLRLTHIDEGDHRTSKTWQYSIKQDCLGQGVLLTREEYLELLRITGHIPDDSVLDAELLV